MSPRFDEPLDDEYWAEVRAAMGKGTPSILLGTSSRSLDKALARTRMATENPGACLCSGWPHQPGACPRHERQPLRRLLAWLRALR